MKIWARQPIVDVDEFRIRNDALVQELFKRVKPSDVQVLVDYLGYKVNLFVRLYGEGSTPATTLAVATTILDLVLPDGMRRGDHDNVFAEAYGELMTQEELDQASIDAQNQEQEETEHGDITEAPIQ